MTSQKIKGHLFYIASSFVHHLKILGEFKLELLSGNAQFGSKSAIFVSRGNLKFDGWSWKTIGHLFYATLTLEYHFKGIREFKLELQSGNAKFWSKSAIHCPVWPWNLMLTYDLDKKNNRPPLLCCFKLCASFHSHRWIQTKVTVRKRSIRVKIGDLLSRVNLKFDGWPWKAAGHLFYVASRYMHHSIAISEFKLKLHSGNAQFGWKSANFVLCDLEIWRMALKSNRVPLLCYFKLCASFHSHWCIQTGVTVRKWPIWVQIDDFLAMWPWNLRDDLTNNRAPFLSNIKLYASFHHHMWIQTGVTDQKPLSWVITSLTLTFDIWAWPFARTSLLSLVIKLINDKISWCYDDGNIVKKVWQTDRRIDGQTERFIELLGCS